MKRPSQWAVWMLGLSLLAGCRSANAPANSNNSNAEPPMGTVVSVTNENIKPTPAPNNFPAQIVVPVGTVGYRVDGMAWQDKLGDGSTPAAGKKFLLVTLSLVNTGPKEAPVAALRLTDGKTEYPLSNKGGKMPNYLNEIKQLAKDERKQGILVFEAPESRSLKLKITAAPPVKDEMFVDLASLAKPTASPQAKPTASSQTITPEERLKRGMKQ